MTGKKIRELKGANMDIDLISSPSWPQDRCPWNVAENTDHHKCAVKNISICRHFRGIEKPDVVLCAHQ
jgi:hypothetical protein